jgi:hypothetical protein
LVVVQVRVKWEKEGKAGLVAIEEMTGEVVITGVAEAVEAVTSTGAAVAPVEDRLISQCDD